MLKVWGRISSINVRKVVLTAQWLGIPFERVDAGHEFGIVKTPHYLAMNPNALVPTLEDGEVPERLGRLLRERRERGLDVHRAVRDLSEQVAHALAPHAASASIA